MKILKQAETISAVAMARKITIKNKKADKNLFEGTWEELKAKSDNYDDFLIKLSKLIDDKQVYIS